MKTKYFILSVLLFSAFSAIGQIRITTSNVTSIGNLSANDFLTVDYTGYMGSQLDIYPVSGTPYAFLGKTNRQFLYMYSVNFSTASDSRCKENIRNINNALSLVKKLNGVKYDYTLKFFAGDSSKISSLKINTINKIRKNHIGFIAQDVFKILPEVVTHDDSTDLYGIDYSKFVPVLAEAIKELSLQVDSLKQLVNKKNTNSLKSAPTQNISNPKSGESLSATQDIAQPESRAAILYQNSPNPFNQSTEIKYYLPLDTKQAMLYIYNMQGNPIKSISVHNTGNSSIVINGNELNPGMYLYTLIADGKEVDTKRMILTE